MRRSSWFLALQLLFAAAVLWFVAGRIAEQWREARTAGFGYEPRWWLILLSAVIVFITYAVLIEAWRYMVGTWGSVLSRRDAARIWFVSNLGRYIPGKVWQIGAMGVMAQRVGVSPIAATGSSIVINLVNLVAGVLVVAVIGAGELSQSSFFGGRRGVQLIVLAAIALGASLLLLPRWLPKLFGLAGRVAGKAIEVPPLPTRAIWVAAVASALAWLLYGVAFYFFARGLTPAAHGTIAGYVVVFTASYILGYVMLPVPGGLVVREGALGALLAQLGLAAGGAGILIAVASRLWLTVTEVLPGVGYLLAGARLPGGPASQKSLGNAAND